MYNISNADIFMLRYVTVVLCLDMLMLLKY